MPTPSDPENPVYYGTSFVIRVFWERERDWDGDGDGGMGSYGPAPVLLGFFALWLFNINTRTNIPIKQRTAVPPLLPSLFSLLSSCPRLHVDSSSDRESSRTLCCSLSPRPLYREHAAQSLA